MKKTRSNKAPAKQAQQQPNGTSDSKLAKFLDPNSSWDKDKLLDTLYWIRQAIGLFCGLLWGAIPLVGAIWIVLFVAISTGTVYWVYSQRLNIDEEEFGGHGAILQEGFFASFTLFLLCWILVYSLVHF
ncbi:rab5-interacting family protein [Carex rostrata]